MGQVGYQDARTSQDVDMKDLDSKIRQLRYVATTRHTEFSEVIAIYRVMAYEARTRLLQEDGDYKDEL